MAIQMHDPVWALCKVIVDRMLVHSVSSIELDVEASQVLTHGKGVDTSTSRCKLDTWTSRDEWERVWEEVGKQEEGYRMEAWEHETHDGWP